MEQPAPSYHGDEAFVFVSYSHADEKIVYDEIRWLQDHDVNVWYDTRIRAGSEWSDAIADAISRCHRFVYFITPNSVESENCRRELNHAMEEGRAIVAVHVQETEVPGGLRLNLNNRQAILKHRVAPDVYHASLLDALSSDRTVSSVPRPTAEPRRYQFVTAAAFIVLIAAVAIWLLRRDTDGPELSDTATGVQAPLSAIAVMPFIDLSPDGNQAWLASGMTQELVQTLSRISELRIPGRISTSVLKQQGADIEFIREALDVGSTIEGSVSKVENEILVVVSWFRTSDESQLWSGRYQEPTEDLFSIQKSIAMDVAEAIRTELGVENVVSFLNDARYEATDVRSWELNQKATELLLTGESEKMREGRALLHKSLEYDPNNIHARSSLVITDYLNPGRRLSDARRLYRQGVRSSGIIRVLIQESIRVWDYQTAQQLLNDAVAASPSAGNLMLEAFSIARALGRQEQALEFAARGAKLDPLWWITSMNLGLAQLENGKPELGIETLEGAIRSAKESDQGFNVGDVYTLLAVALNQSGRTEDAVEALVRSAPAAEDVIRQGYEKGGWKGMNLAMANIYAERFSFCNAPRFADAREPDKMYGCLEQWVTGDDGALAKYVPVHLSFDFYRQEPRFKAMADRFQARIQQSAGSFSLDSLKELDEV